MADVLSGDIALAIPFFLERQCAEDAIGQAAHLVDAPACPAPQLRRYEIQNGDAVRAGTAGQPPVKAGKVDQHQNIRPLLLEDSIGQTEDAPELRHVGEDAEKA